ncbi:MAG: alanine racemase [Coriobacteriia bacterium]|nr:alanine racemase [Coriobacteriia bacterium]
MTHKRAAWLDIDLQAISDNVVALRGFVAEGAKRTAAAQKIVLRTPKFMAVVKADAYGHGAVSVARTALQAGADWLGVATPAEAFELREAGISAPILLLSEPPETILVDLLESDITCTVASTEFLQTLAGFALLQQRQISYHLKVDTGMKRVGVPAEAAVSIVREAANLPLLQMGGIFTHFATADTAGDWDASQQLEAFQGIVRRLADMNLRPQLVHASNSAATLLMPDALFDMVRVGISMYGIHPSDDTRKLIDLTPALSVRAQASMVKSIGMGEGVGYGLTWRAHKPVHIITLPLGYADGIPRLCSNKMDVLVDKPSLTKGARRIEQVGTICMDQMMVAASSSLAVHQGDEFVLVGAPRCSSDAASVRAIAREVRTVTRRKIDDYLAVEELAEQAQTIPYEILCGLGQRLERVYRNG